MSLLKTPRNQRQIGLSSFPKAGNDSRKQSRGSSRGCSLSPSRSPPDALLRAGATGTGLSGRPALRPAPPATNVQGWEGGRLSLPSGTHPSLRHPVLCSSGGRRVRWEDRGVLSHGGNPSPKVLLGGDSFPALDRGPGRSSESHPPRHGTGPQQGCGRGERQPRRDPLITGQPGTLTQTLLRPSPTSKWAARNPCGSTQESTAAQRPTASPSILVPV